MLCLCVVAFDRSVCPYDVLGVLNSEVRVDVDVDEPGDIDTAFQEVVVVRDVRVSSKPANCRKVITRFDIPTKTDL